jgi:serine/threonine protein kinase
MALAAGTRLGPYEIVALIGTGGMGEVYSGRDTRLRRDVAIKILRADSVEAPDRRRRFELEARAASSLNHPNILTIFDIGDEGGTHYIVSELLEGKPLRGLIERGPLPIRSLLEMAVEISSGLAAAHAAGITHRDLKPENLFRTEDGRTKILDFGLAKSSEAPLPDDLTRSMTDLATSPGVIVGTIAYMSPEQAQGNAVDYRSDQFSFGSILYEMATGKRPFQRDDRVGTLAAIVGQEPAPIPSKDVPPPLRWIIDRCLAKDPAARFASTTDLHQQLRDLKDHLSELSAFSPAPGTSPPPARRRLAPVLAALAVGAAGIALAWTIGKPTPADEPYRFTPFATEAMLESEPAWSPDGLSLAYVGRIGGKAQIFTRSLNSSSPAQITKEPEDCFNPFWSPDGTRLYYRSRGNIWSVGAAGGASQVAILNVAADRVGSAVISPDGKTFAFMRAEGRMASLYLQPVAGGDAVLIKRPPFPTTFRFFDGVQFSPDGRSLLVNVLPAIDVKKGGELWLIPLPDGTPRRVPTKFRPSTEPRDFHWAGDNRHVVFASELIPGGGSHLYEMDTETGDFRAITGGAGEERQPAVSPDGRKIAYVSGVDDSDLMEVSLDGSRVSPLLATSRREYTAFWSPSGLQYTYVSNASGIPGIWMRSVAEGWVRQLVEGSAEGSLYISQPRQSPDGQRLAYLLVSDRHAVMVVNMSGGRAVPLETETSDQHTPTWSPDGNWIAYARFVGQEWEIAKAPAGGGGRPVRLSDGGTSGGWLAWAPGGEWIGFRDPQGLKLVSPEGGTPRQVHPPCPAFAFSRDGGLLYVIRRAKDGHWELATLSVPEGTVKQTAALNIPPEKAIQDMSLHPDGTRFAVTVTSGQRDIWVLDGFHAR